MPSWCDKLASTPAVGIFMDRYYSSSADTLDSLAPLINRWTKNDEDEFSIAKQDSFSVEITTNNGFHYGISPGHTFVEFKHRLRVTPRSGEVPTVEMLSEAAPYTKLLSDVIQRLGATTELLSPNGSREMKRIGVVSSTTVDGADAPPGILRMIEYMSSPWKHTIPAYDFQVVALVAENEKWQDRCTVHVHRKEGADSLINVKLDFQRSFKELRRVSAYSESMKLLTDEALQYFELIALGSMFHGDKR